MVILVLQITIIMKFIEPLKKQIHIFALAETLTFLIDFYKKFALKKII